MACNNNVAESQDVEDVWAGYSIKDSVENINHWEGDFNKLCL